MLAISDLNATYGSLQVLFGVNLEARPGEITLLIGPNGAGKSTVLKSIFQFATVTLGSITFDGKDILSIPRHDLIRYGISYVPQGRNVFGTLTVEENVRLGAFLLHNRKEVERRLEAVYSFLPLLKEKSRTRAGSLSGGQQQLLALGRSLMQEPKLLLLDEPSLGLSPVAMKEIFDNIVAIKNRGVAVLMVEQNAKAGAAIADRIYLLETGRVVLSGGREILEHEKIKHVYLGGV